MKRYPQRERNRAEKKIQIAINKLIDLQDMGFGCNEVGEILDRLRSLETDVQSTAQGLFSE